MHRYLFKLGAVTVYSYGALLALAFLLGTVWAAQRAKRYAIDRNTLVDLVLVILIFSLIGARIFFVFLEWDYYRLHLADALKIWEGGLVFYGGLLAGLAAAAGFIRVKKMRFSAVADVLSPPIALGIAIGRLGCFLNGCCWGKISFRWGICFPARDNPGPFAQQVYAGLISPHAACSLPVLPTQLYEAVACLMICLVLLRIERHAHAEGSLFWTLVLLYAVFRFFIEGVRYYEPCFILGSLTVSQLISIALSAVAAAMLVCRVRPVLRRKDKN